jgi:hypothetical protein
MKKTLHLTLKKKWFDMIKSGVKKEEYREVKAYWMKRIAGLDGCGTGYNFTILRDAGFNFERHIFDTIIFHNGYGKNAPKFEIECKSVVVDQGKKKWGAPDYRVFVLKLGEIIQ